MPPPDERRLRFEEIYADNHDAVLGYAMRRTDSADDAADVLAETFLTAWRRLDDVPPSEQARPWLYGVARRVLANHHRGSRRRSALADRLRADLAGARHTPEPDNLDQVAHVLRNLPERDRELLCLIAWEDLDPGQIATVLGCSRNAVRVRLHRARRRFTRELERRDALAQPASSSVQVVKGDIA